MELSHVDARKGLLYQSLPINHKCKNPSTITLLYTSFTSLYLGLSRGCANVEFVVFIHVRANLETGPGCLLFMGHWSFVGRQGFWMI